MAVKKKQSTKAIAARVKKVTPELTLTQPATINKPQSPMQMLKNPKIYLPLIVIIFCVLLYAFKGLFIVAIVNGQPVGSVGFIQALEKQSGKQVLQQQIIPQMLIDQEAAKKHITISPQDVQNQIKQIQTSLSKQGQTLDSALAARGMTRQVLEDQIATQVKLEKLLGNQTKVTDKEIEAYINSNKDSLPQDQKPEALRAQIKQQLEQQKFNEKAQTYVQTLQQKAKITYFVNL